MQDRNYRFPTLQRDLVLIGAGVLLVASAVGAVIGVAVDVLIHRHRAV